MLRKAPRIAPLLVALRLGRVLARPAVTVTRPLAHAGALAAAAVIAVGTAGCEENESDPLTHVARLNESAKQTKAVETLVSMTGHKLSDDKGDRSGASYKALIDKIIDPLNKLCMDGKMTESARPQVIKLLADTWDVRAAPCLNKILSEWNQGTGDTEALQIFRGVAGSKMPELADNVIAAFAKLKYSDAQQDNLFRDVQAAAQAVATKSHSKIMLELLDKPIPSEKDGKKVDPKAVNNQVFWQYNAMTILGKLKDETAIKPIVKVLLTPAKSAISQLNTAALIALARMGTAVLKVASPLISNGAEVQDLIDFSTAERKALIPSNAKKDDLEAQTKAAGKAHISIAADLLANIGTAEAIDPLLKALEGADDQTKAVIALKLPGLPKSEKTITAYKQVFESIKLDTSLPNYNPARNTMFAAASAFYDSSLVPWLIAQATSKDIKIDPDKFTSQDLEDYQRAALESAFTLMTIEQLPDVQKFYDTPTADKKSTIGKAYEDNWNYSRFVLEECKSDVDCYIAKITDAKYQKEAQFPKEGLEAGKECTDDASCCSAKCDKKTADAKTGTCNAEKKCADKDMLEKGASHEAWNKAHKENVTAAVKSGVMIAVLNKPDVKSKLIDALPTITSGRIKNTVLGLITFYSPNGDKASAEKLQALVDKMEEAKDPRKDLEANGIKQFIAALQMRQ